MDALLRKVQSPVGEITLGATSTALILCATGDCVSELKKELQERGIYFKDSLDNESASEILERSEKALKLYFTGELSALQSIPLAPMGTDFQKAVWKELLLIRGGDIASYKAISEALNNPGAARAVGLACRLNPIHLFIPCHRIISVDGALTGFRGGVERKQFLLDFERHTQEAEVERLSA